MLEIHEIEIYLSCEYSKIMRYKCIFSVNLVKFVSMSYKYIRNVNICMQKYL